VDLVRRDVERWREVVLLAGAKVARGAPFCAWTLARKLCPSPCGIEPAELEWLLALIAGHMICETGIALSDHLDTDDEECRKNIVDWLVRLAGGGQLPPRDRVAAGVTLGILGDPRKGVGLTPAGLPEIDWIEIPAGPFIMGTGSDRGERSLIKEPYFISRYPVTVAQYQAFVDSGGYGESGKRYWTRAGWTWKEKEDIRGPKVFESVFQTANHPRVGVSWYEAVAFCLWLGERLNLRVMLPSGAQWERAARHTDGRDFPWGSEKNAAERCNIDGTGIGHTSAVGLFPMGNTLSGACDMAGNAWEWCRTLYHDDPGTYDRETHERLEGESARVLRGGAWYDDAANARCAYCLGIDPVGRNSDVGFRVAASPQSL